MEIKVNPSFPVSVVITFETEEELAAMCAAVNASQATLTANTPGFIKIDARKFCSPTTKMWETFSKLYKNLCLNQ
jgi:hypothetical protein